MRIFHLSDLHIGKQFYGYSLLEDQEYILRQVVEQVRERKPDVLLIAGDIYDKSVPSGEAVEVFDRFLTALAAESPELSVLLIAGNHDSPQRLMFGAELLRRQRIHLAGSPPMQPGEYIRKVTLKDSYGVVDFWMVPFLKPGYTRKLFEEEYEEGKKLPATCDEAFTALLAREGAPDPAKRHVLLAHQFFMSRGVNPIRSDSETLMVGGLDQVDTDCLAGFDYVALGHIHRPQSVGDPWIRYCGTPLKYSVSEWNQEKSLTEVDLGAKKDRPQIRQIPLKPLRDVKLIRGQLSDILRENEGTICEDYVSILLTDERELYQPKERLESIFPHILEVRMERTGLEGLEPEEEALEKAGSPQEIFVDFFRQMQGRWPDEEECEILEAALQKAGEEV